MTRRRSALITGASRGIGAAIAKRFAEQGWDLTLSARSEDDLRAVAAELSGFGTTIDVVPADLTDTASIERLTAAHTGSFGGIDALILNAGIGRVGRIADFPTHRYEQLFEVNLLRPFQLIQQTLPTLRATAQDVGVARVVAIASISGVYPAPTMAAYGSMKAALLSLCETLNAEESSRGVCATVIAPGYVATDLTADVPGIPHSAMITVDDVASLAYAVTDLSAAAVVPSVVLARPGENLHRP